MLVNEGTERWALIDRGGRGGPSVGVLNVLMSSDELCQSNDVNAIRISSLLFT